MASDLYPFVHQFLVEHGQVSDDRLKRPNFKPSVRLQAIFQEITEAQTAAEPQLQAQNSLLALVYRFLRASGFEVAARALWKKLGSQFKTISPATTLQAIFEEYTKRHKIIGTKRKKAESTDSDTEPQPKARKSLAPGQTSASRTGKDIDHKNKASKPAAPTPTKPAIAAKSESDSTNREDGAPSKAVKKAATATKNAGLISNEEDISSDESDGDAKMTTAAASKDSHADNQCFHERDSGTTMSILMTPTTTSVSGAQFKTEKVGDLSMKVANIPGVGPFFLDHMQHLRLGNIISKRPQGMLTVISGTIKCGKSVLLEKIIPTMVLDNPHPDKRPVFVYVQVKTRSSPQDVANLLRIKVQQAATHHGIDLSIVDTSLAQIDPLTCAETAVPTIVEMFSDKGFELWILLDEIQEPFVGQSLSSVADRYSGFLKGLYEDCCKVGGRVVMTGSGMVTLLSKIRKIPANGIYLWGETEILSRGHAYDHNVFAKMIDLTLEYFKPSFQPPLDSFVTREHILAKFEKDSEMVSRRPALLAYFLSRLAAISTVDDAQESFDTAWRTVLEKLSSEANLQTADGLCSLDTKERILLHKFACNELTAEQFSCSDKTKSLFRIIESLSELPDPSGNRQLQPPYGSLFKSWILPDGSLCVGIQQRQLVHLSPTSKNLTVISDSEGIFNTEAKQAIHDAIVKVIFPSGPPNPTKDDISKADCVKIITSKLGHDPKKHKDNVKFKKMLSSPHTSPNLWGFKFLTLVRHFITHIHDHTSLTALGSDFLTRIVKEASAALVGVQEGDFGLEGEFLYTKTQEAAVIDSVGSASSVGGPSPQAQGRKKTARQRQGHKKPSTFKGQIHQTGHSSAPSKPPGHKVQTTIRKPHTRRF